MLSPIYSKYSYIDGVKIHYLTAGSGPPFIIFHALFSDAETFTGLINCLSGNFKIYVPDFPGFGKSDNLPQGNSFTDDNDLICRWIEEMGLNNFVLAGFSLGGLNIIQAIKRLDTKVTKYILIEPYYNFHALKMPPQFIKKVQKWVAFSRKYIAPQIGQKIWDSDIALKIFFKTVDPLKKEARSVKDKIKNLRTAKYATFMYYLDLVMNHTRLDAQAKSEKDALLIMSRYDSTLDFAVTYEGYLHYFNKIKEKRVDLIDHYPTEPLTARFFKTHFAIVIDEMIKLSNEKYRNT